MDEEKSVESENARRRRKKDLSHGPRHRPLYNNYKAKIGLGSQTLDSYWALEIMKLPIGQKGNLEIYLAKLLKCVP